MSWQVALPSNNCGTPWWVYCLGYAVCCLFLVYFVDGTLVHVHSS